MIRTTSALTGLALVVALGANGAMAAATAKVSKPKTPESIACSQQADAKNLHGKERKAFRSTCLKDAHAAAATKKPTAPAADKKS